MLHYVEKKALEHEHDESEELREFAEEVFKR